MKNKSEERETFLNRLEVTKYLQENGWKISKSTLYNKFGKAKLLPRDDGLFYLKDIEKFSNTFLKRQSTGMRVQVEQDELQRKKAHLEVEKLEIEIARARHKKETEEGLYIPRDQLEIELASRAAVLDAGIGHFFQSDASNWINLIGGDHGKLRELIDVLMAAKDGFMNRYATTKEFVVEIVKGKEAED